jgi:hypothetical protein
MPRRAAGHLSRPGQRTGDLGGHRLRIGEGPTAASTLRTRPSTGFRPPEGARRCSRVTVRLDATSRGKPLPRPVPPGR